MSEHNEACRTGAFYMHGACPACVDDFEARIRADEREACAKLADDYECQHRHAVDQHTANCSWLAQRIRARGGGK